MKVLEVHGHEVLLDDYDWLRLCCYNWRVRTVKSEHDAIYIYYKKTINGKRETIYIHRAVISPPYGLDLKTEEESHHKDGNTLNNQRENLEILLREEHGRRTRSNNETGN